MAYQRLSLECAEACRIVLARRSSVLCNWLSQAKKPSVAFYVERRRLSTKRVPRCYYGEVMASSEHTWPAATLACDRGKAEEGYGNAPMSAALSAAAATRESGTTSTSSRRRLVLGIESSCDDTGAAVVDDEGHVLGECLRSQTEMHTEMGGIIPVVARDMHKLAIDDVVTQALRQADVTLNDVDAIATTVEPGLTLSLLVGLNYTKQLLNRSRKPFIPIHHMEAHALTVRMLHRNLSFPFLVLLMSGGHCLLTVVKDVTEYLLLGSHIDDSPGDLFDKTARRLKLKRLAECRGLSGGASVERLSCRGKPDAFDFPAIMMQQRDCNFSFAGLKFFAKKLIEEEEQRHDTAPDEVIPSAADLCASLQYAVLRHMATRLQRAFIYCDQKKLLPDYSKVLVLSGGVASNAYLRRGLQEVCSSFQCQIICPPPHLCTDNGVMVAWNGMERLIAGRGILRDAEGIDVKGRSPLGRDLSADVTDCAISVKPVKLRHL